MKKAKIIAFNPGTLVLRALLAGVVSGSAACALLLLLAAAGIRASGSLPQELLQPIVLAVCGLSALLAGYLSAKIAKRRGLLFGAASGALLFVICLVGGVANAHSALSASALTRLLVMLLAGALGGFWAVNRKPKIR